MMWLILSSPGTGLGASCARAWLRESAASEATIPDAIRRFFIRSAPLRPAAGLSWPRDGMKTPKFSLVKEGVQSWRMGAKERDRLSSALPSALTEVSSGGHRVDKIELLRRG